MSKNYLMKGTAALLTGMIAASCSHDLGSDINQVNQQQALNNAQATLGFYIPENQDWSMVSTGNINLTIPGNAGEAYTVKVYSNDPQADGIGYVITQQQVMAGQPITAELGIPSHLTTIVISITDSKGNTTYKRAAVNNGQITAFVEDGKERTRGITKTFGEQYSFPSDADASNFVAAPPSGVSQITKNDASVNGWIDDSWSGEINIWGGWDGQKTTGGTIYFKKGTYDFTNRNFYIAPNTEVFLCEGAVLKLSANAAGNLQAGCNYYIAKDAKIETDGELKLNNGLHMYNHGTIEAVKMDVNNDSWLVNKSIVKVKENLQMANGLSVFVNDGDLTANSLNTAGSAKFQNNADVVIYDNTVVNSNSNTWINNGHYRTKYFNYTAGSDQVINNCFLTVDEDFNINLGDNPGNGCFRMNAGAGVLTKNFNGGGVFSGHNGGPFYIYMKAGSVFKVTQTATMSATKASYGIYNLDDDWAVFQAKDIVAQNIAQGYEVTYGGKLAVVAETHFDSNTNYSSKSGQYPIIDFVEGCSKENIYINGSKPNITVTASTCNPGFTGSTTEPDPTPTPTPTPDPGPEPTPTPEPEPEIVNMPEIYSFAFEDSNLKSDYDMNDVVIKAQLSEDGSTLKLWLVAAGCEYDNTVYMWYNGQYNAITWDNGETEVHKALRVGQGKVTNTGRGSQVAFATATIATPGGYQHSTAKFAIMPSGGDMKDKYIEIASEGGQNPCGIRIPWDWSWPTERTNIVNAYPRFATWGGEANIDTRRTYADWYKSPSNGLVMKYNITE